MHTVATSIQFILIAVAALTSALDYEQQNPWHETAFQDGLHRIQQCLDQLQGDTWPFIHKILNLAEVLTQVTAFLVGLQRHHSDEYAPTKTIINLKPNCDEKMKVCL